jgi:alpha-glucosidase
VKIVDSTLTAYQVQEEILPRPKNENAAASGAALEFDIVEKPFSFTVKRKANGEVLFDTTAGKLVFEKQYVRWRTALPKEPNIYGMGEHSDSFRFPTVYRRVLFNSESPNIPQKSNLYGTHPVYFDHRGDKGTHGVFLLNSNAMEIFMDQNPSGTQYLEYNTIGGVIDLYFLAGKQPAEVSKQYADVVGYSPMYPYWTFGFHQCRFGYYDVNMVAEVVGNYSTAGIPLEVMWTDIDYMNLRQDFTTDPDRFPIPKMRELISTLHERDQRYVVILDPGVHAVGNYPTYQKGHDMGVFLKGADGTDLLGDQWPGAVVWPDWFAPKTQQWWTDEIQNFFSKDTGLDLDGLWVDMNEASNFCSDQNCNARQEEISQNLPPKPTQSPRPNTGRPIPGFPADFQPTTKGLQTRDAGDGKMLGYPDREWFHPNYRVNSHRGDLTQFTIFTNTSNYDGSRQYDTHNFYGHMMAHTTYNSMLSRRPGLRPFVLTRSTFAGTGRKVAHWYVPPIYVACETNTNIIPAGSATTSPRGSTTAPLSAKCSPSCQCIRCPWSAPTSVASTATQINTCVLDGLSSARSNPSTATTRRLAPSRRSSTNGPSSPRRPRRPSKHGTSSSTTSTPLCTTKRSRARQ